ncbi:MAG TPA: family 43 glycosylhydrolase [Phycisphaerae bacterium]|nr:family 43 glycosylhydrolase [Phycisphaerae bacterium]HRY71272.1 family 43 glycosylhydrolase [Phycisphaerae bacterium]
MLLRKPETPNPIGRRGCLSPRIAAKKAGDAGQVWVACVRWRAATAVLLLLVLSAQVPVTAQTYSNPLDTPAFPPAGDGCCGPADPCAIEAEGTYYVYPTGEGWGYKVMASDDLVHWTGEAIAFVVPQNSPWKSGSAWAPEVERINGTYYLYYTAGNGGLDRQHIGVAEAASPWGPFTDRSVAAPLIAQTAIDAECFQDGGQLYLYHVRWEGGRLSTWVQRLSDPLTLAPEPSQLCISGTGWEATVNEGPGVLKRNGKYYLFYSGNYAHTADYAVGVAVADHPLGPWTKQPNPYNPVFRRDDAIALYGPGHGHHVVGPDALADWYVYHQKIDPTDTFNGGLNYRRHLGLDRVVPVARDGSYRLRITSSGGTTGPTLAPRRATLFCNFNEPPLPLGMTARAGVWNITEGRLLAPVEGKLQVDRPLSPENLQDFVCEWWLQAEPGFSTSGDSAVTFSFGRDTGSQSLGFRLRPPVAGLEFGQADILAEDWVTLASFSLPAEDSLAFSRRITITHQGSRWRLLIDRELAGEVDQPASLGSASWVATSALPCRLDGYRYTAAFDDAFECSGCTSDRWTFLGGQWECVAPTASDDGCLRQADLSPGMKLALCNTISSAYFDLEADFLLLKQNSGNGRFPKHGLVHSYADAGNYAMVFIDEQYDVVATNAMIGGVLQQWINAGTPLPVTYSSGGYHHLAAAVDVTSGEFVYSLNGQEMIRRTYPALSAGGQTGLVAELSDVQIDNFRVSHALPMARIALDQTTIQQHVHIGTDPPPDTVLISNSGQGLLTYQFSEDTDWLTVEPTAGESASEADAIQLVYDLSRLQAGTYVADVAVVAMSAENSPQHLHVELTIGTVQPDFDGDGDVDQSDFGKLQACFTENVTPSVVPGGCEAADLNGDKRVTGADLALFLGCFEGPGVIPAANCSP